MIRLTRAQSRAIDRLALEKYHIPGIVLMENAARAAADVARDMLGSNLKVTIVCGGGNNGGDGLAIARHLHNFGCDVRIALALDPKQYTGDALINWRIVEAMELPHAAFSPDSLREADLILDALLGTGLSTPPREDALRIIEQLNSATAPILAVDLPSGMDCDTGAPTGKACVRATRTVTFVTEKIGFAKADAKKWTGPITVGDIGVPVELIARVASGT